MARTMKSGLDKRQESIIDKNIIEANISLMDKNKLLEADNTILQRRHNRAIKYMQNYIKVKDNDANVKEEFEEVIGILEGTRDEVNKT